MKAGQVVRLRINPSDCQSVLDILELAGIETKGMSFASCVSLALSSAIQTLKQAKCIEEPDAFQFLERMAQFRITKMTRTRKQIADTMYKGQAMGLKSPALEIPIQSPQKVTGNSLSIDEGQRLEFLYEKRDKEGLTQEEQVEFQELDRRMFG